MYLWTLSLLLVANISFAAVGSVELISSKSDASLSRGAKKLSVSKKMKLNAGDELETQDSSLLINLNSRVQLSLAPHTHLKINSAPSLTKGSVRVLVTKQKVDQKFEGESVSFTSKDADFEVSREGDNFDLSVVKGEVQVASPFINTFVPEIVKANEGFRFNLKAKSFERRKFAFKFNTYPGFVEKK